VDSYLENVGKVETLEKEKKQAAMDEDFEKALDCKKQLQKVKVDIDLQARLITQFVEKDLDEQLTDKDILLQIVKHEEATGKFNLSNLLVKTQHSQSKLTQTSILGVWAIFMHNQGNQEEILKNLQRVSHKIDNEIQTFLKVSSKLSEALEVSFDDKEIEKQN